MLTKTEQDKWIREATAAAVAILKDEVLMLAGEISNQNYLAQTHYLDNEKVTEVLAAIENAFYRLHDNLAAREEDLRDDT